MGLHPSPLGFRAFVFGSASAGCTTPFHPVATVASHSGFQEDQKREHVGPSQHRARHAEHLFRSRCYCELSPCLPSSNAHHTSFTLWTPEKQCCYSTLGGGVRLFKPEVPTASDFSLHHIPATTWGPPGALRHLLGNTAVHHKPGVEHDPWDRHHAYSGTSASLCSVLNVASTSVLATIFVLIALHKY